MPSRAKKSGSLGAFIGALPAANTNGFDSFGIAYGVATFGPSERSVTAGLGYGFANHTRSGVLPGIPWLGFTFRC